ARLTAGAATIWLAGQAVINIGYVTNLLPVTGIPLPFISAGGTSLLATFFVFGMLVSFARHEPEAVAAAQRASAAGERGWLARVTRLPVPQAYAPPPRRARPVAPPARAAASAAMTSARAAAGGRRGAVPARGRQPGQVAGRSNGAPPRMTVRPAGAAQSAWSAPPRMTVRPARAAGAAPPAGAARRDVVRRDEEQRDDEQRGTQARRSA
ncbi:MAG: FtsW/RodA/SpoVE family cell cycle protein, partial [Actinomycetia bacterium]|nr:FtsW/RodA/SpoVE family cell cycle protein [Actinomycetes bacterium]